MTVTRTGRINIANSIAKAQESEKEIIPDAYCEKWDRCLPLSIDAYLTKTQSRLMLLKSHDCR